MFTSSFGLKETQQVNRYAIIQDGESSENSSLDKSKRLDAFQIRHVSACPYSPSLSEVPLLCGPPSSFLMLKHCPVVVHHSLSVYKTTSTYYRAPKGERNGSLLLSGQCNFLGQQSRSSCPTKGGVTHPSELQMVDHLKEKITFSNTK